VNRGNWGFADGQVQPLYPADLGFSTAPNPSMTAVPVSTATIDRYFHLQARGL